MGDRTNLNLFAGSEANIALEVFLVVFFGFISFIALLVFGDTYKIHSADWDDNKYREM